jgi:hypothetical protein
VVARRHLGERRADLPADALDLRHQQPADPAFADAGIDDQGHHPDHPVAVLEARQGVRGDEPEHLAVVIRDEDAGVLGVEPGEPLDDVAGPGRVALVREQRGDPLGVVRRRRPDVDGVTVGHRGRW